MSKPLEELLIDMQKHINAGDDPEYIIPYSFECMSESDWIRILMTAVRVLPEGSPRRITCERKLRMYSRR